MSIDDVHTDESLALLWDEAKALAAAHAPPTPFQIYLKTNCDEAMALLPAHDDEPSVPGPRLRPTDHLPAVSKAPPFVSIRNGSTLVLNDPDRPVSSYIPFVPPRSMPLPTHRNDEAKKRKRSEDEEEE